MQASMATKATDSGFLKVLTISQFSGSSILNSRQSLITTIISTKQEAHHVFGAKYFGCNIKHRTLNIIICHARLLHIFRLLFCTELLKEGVELSSSACHNV